MATRSVSSAVAGDVSLPPIASADNAQFTIRANGGTGERMELTRFVRGAPTISRSLPILSF